MVQKSAVGWDICLAVMLAVNSGDGKVASRAVQWAATLASRSVERSAVEKELLLAAETAGKMARRWAAASDAKLACLRAALRAEWKAGATVWQTAETLAAGLAALTAGWSVEWKAVTLVVDWAVCLDLMLAAARDSQWVEQRDATVAVLWAGSRVLGLVFLMAARTAVCWVCCWAESLAAHWADRWVAC
jgi:hypothetical protein